MSKKIIYLLFIAVFAISIVSCEDDEGKLPKISFKTGTNYKSTDDSLTAGSAFTIGINASKTEDKDVLKKFNISKSIDGASAVTIFSKDLSGSEGDDYNYDYSDTMSHVIGQTNKYIFTVTNRDGISNNVSLTLKVR